VLEKASMSAFDFWTKGEIHNEEGLKKKSRKKKKNRGRLKREGNLKTNAAGVRGTRRGDRLRRVQGEEGGCGKRE